MTQHLHFADEYTLDDQGRIRPVYTVGWVRTHWNDVATFDDALLGVIEVAKEDALNEREIGAEELADLQAKRYLNVADAFYLATGFDARFGVYRFTWQGETYFTMRPDFFLMSIVSDLSEAAANALEDAVRTHLLDYYRYTDAIKSAQLHGELDASKVYPIEWWLEFWRIRGLPVPNADSGVNAGSGEKTLKTTERNTLLTVIAALCDYSAIDIKARGTAHAIARMTEELGAPVSHDSVRRALERIPGALEARRT